MQNSAVTTFDVVVVHVTLKTRLRQDLIPGIQLCSAAVIILKQFILSYTVHVYIGGSKFCTLKNEAVTDLSLISGVMAHCQDISVWPEQGSSVSPPRSVL